MQRARCLGVANEPLFDDKFFPGRGETADKAITQYCFKCEVRKECDNFADEVGAESGVWGGKRRTRGNSDT